MNNLERGYKQNKMKPEVKFECYYFQAIFFFNFTSQTNVMAYRILLVTQNCFPVISSPEMVQQISQYKCVLGGRTRLYVVLEQEQPSLSPSSFHTISVAHLVQSYTDIRNFPYEYTVKPIAEIATIYSRDTNSKQWNGFCIRCPIFKLASNFKTRSLVSQQFIKSD